jgi:hypothetical protein
MLFLREIQAGKALGEELGRGSISPVISVPIRRNVLRENLMEASIESASVWNEDGAPLEEELGECGFRSFLVEA